MNQCIIVIEEINRDWMRINNTVSHAVRPYGLQLNWRSLFEDGELSFSKINKYGDIVDASAYELPEHVTAELNGWINHIKNNLELVRNMLNENHIKMEGQTEEPQYDKTTGKVNKRHDNEMRRDAVKFSLEINRGIQSKVASGVVSDAKIIYQFLKGE